MIPRRLVTDDGVGVVLTRARAHRDGRPAALLVHGAFTNHRVWLGADGGGGGLAHFLSERGLDVWLADLRHHGASDREPAPGRWRFEDCIRHDAPALIARILDETGGAPLVWVGHSSGGAVGLSWLVRLGATTPLAGLVAIGTPGPYRMGPVRRAGAGALRGIARTLGRVPGRSLRLGSEDEAGGILGDWLEWNARGAWVGADGFDYLAAWAQTETPFLAVAGGRDHFFAPPRACEQLTRLAGGRRKESTTCPRLSHRGLLRDAHARERCWPRLAQWIEDTLLWR